MIMSAIGLDAHPGVDAVSADDAFREDFLRVAAIVGLSRDQAAVVVELSSGRSFETCAPADLLPILHDLMALAQRANGGSCER